MTELVRTLRAFTAARIGLAASGSSLATREVLQLAQDHALARDAVHAGFDTQPLLAALEAQGHPVAEVQSCASDRATYLRRPDYGRQLAPTATATLAALRESIFSDVASFVPTPLSAPVYPPLSPHASPPVAPPAVAVVIADGLAAAAPSAHALPLLRELVALSPARWAGVPVVLAKQARVALGDAIGASLQARLVLVLIGERPGMSAHDSLGAYLTYSPRSGRTDAERNCVSNIRPEGLPYGPAAFRLHWLVEAALGRGLSGIELKDESESACLHIPAPPANIGA